MAVASYFACLWRHLDKMKLAGFCRILIPSCPALSWPEASEINYTCAATKCQKARHRLDQRFQKQTFCYLPNPTYLAFMDNFCLLTALNEMVVHYINQNIGGKTIHSQSKIRPEKLDFST